MAKKASVNVFGVAGEGSKYSLKGADPAGFWAGLWHGFIAPLAFLVGIFAPNVSMYEINNNGAWYDFGFLLGMGWMIGGRGFFGR